MKNTILRFEDWLNDQQYREDFIGDLARIPSMQYNEQETSRRRFDEHKYWANIVIKIANPRYISIFNDAWQEFAMARKAAKKSAD